jgi:hypothetical protein
MFAKETFEEKLRRETAKIKRQLDELELRELAVLRDLYCPRRKKPEYIPIEWDNTEINF